MGSRLTRVYVVAALIASLSGCQEKTGHLRSQVTTIRSAAQGGGETEVPESASGPLDETRVKVPSPRAAPGVRAACGRIAMVIGECGLKPDVIHGRVGHTLGGRNQVGCRVLAVAPTSTIVGRFEPRNCLEKHFLVRGWTEDLRYAADGPGTSAFAYRKDGILCVFSLGAHSAIEDDRIVTSEDFEFDARCTMEPLEEGHALPPPSAPRPTLPSRFGAGTRISRSTGKGEESPAARASRFRAPGAAAAGVIRHKGAQEWVRGRPKIGRLTDGSSCVRLR